MLDFNSEDIDDMDDDAGDNQEPTPIGHWTATSSHDVYIVDTPKGSDNEEKGDGTGDRPHEKQSKRWRKHRPKPRLDKNPAIEQDEPVDDKQALEQPSEQGNMDRETEHPSPAKTAFRTTSHRINLWSRRISTKGSLQLHAA